MSVAACLLLYGLVVAALGPRLLTRWTSTGVAPRLGVAVWLVAIGSVVLSWATAAGVLAAELVRSWDRPGDLLSRCFAALRAAAQDGLGVLVQVGVLVLTVLAVVVLVTQAGRLARSLARCRASTHEHARLARLAGRRVAGLDAVVLEAPQRLVYCVAGRPHAIVVTSAALDALGDRHLAAVLAHERAHLAGRHHLLLAVTRGLARILPGVGLFSIGATEVARLLEMCADDAAARAHGRRTVLGALLMLSGAGPMPAGALGASGVEVLARAQRLADPPLAAQRVRMRLLLTAVAVLAVAGPLLVGLLATDGFAMCGQLMA